jgi:undecaprenyl-diphosphatase
LVLRLVGDEERARVDRPVLDLVVRHRTGWLDHANKLATAFGSKSVLIPLVLVVGGAYYLRRRRGRWEVLLLLAVATAGAALSSESIKALVHKPRPPAFFHLVGASGYGFPSGHATQAAAVYGILSIVLARSLPRWSQKVAVVASLSVVTLLVGLSRVYLGVHWLTDVLGGWALGWAWAMVVLAADSLRRAPRLPPPPAPADAHPACA